MRESVITTVAHLNEGVCNGTTVGPNVYDSQYYYMVLLGVVGPSTAESSLKGTSAIVRARIASTFW